MHSKQQIRFKAIRHIQYRENVLFYSSPSFYVFILGVVQARPVGNFAFLFSCTWWVGLQTLWWFRLKDLSIDEMVGAWCFGCLSGPPGFTFWISFAPVFSLIHCWVLILALSPCYILIYMFRRWCIDKLGVFHANQISMCLDPHLH